jgi:competence protein ComEC
MPAPSGVAGVLATAAVGVAAVVLWRWRWVRVAALVLATILTAVGLAWTVSGCVRAA